SPRQRRALLPRPPPGVGADLSDRGADARPGRGPRTLSSGPGADRRQPLHGNAQAAFHGCPDDRCLLWMREITEHELRSGYHDADRDFRVQQAKIGCVLVLLCMPLGALLDWFVYRHLMVTL